MSAAEDRARYEQANARWEQSGMEVVAAASAWAGWMEHRLADLDEVEQRLFDAVSDYQAAGTAMVDSLADPEGGAS